VCNKNKVSAHAAPSNLIQSDLEGTLPLIEWRGFIYIFLSAEKLVIIAISISPHLQN
jgi:hypothetical protein